MVMPLCIAEVDVYTERSVHERESHRPDMRKNTNQTDLVSPFLPDGVVTQQHGVERGMGRRCFGHGCCGLYLRGRLASKPGGKRRWRDCSNVRVTTRRVATLPRLGSRAQIAFPAPVTECRRGSTVRRPDR